MVTRHAWRTQAPPANTASVRLFARLSEIAGVRRVVIELGSGLTAREVFLNVCHRFPGLQEYEGRLLFAVNADYASPDTVVKAGDELTLIPPVSGGAAR